MQNKVICRHIILTIIMIMITTVAAAADVSTDVEKILREIRQDQPLPAIDYLQRTKSMNAGCAYYIGNYHGIDVRVETHPSSNRVASVLLQIPGGDRTRQILPAVRGVIGPPRYSKPKESYYFWEWPKYRTASLHYTRGVKPAEGLTIVSLFYQ